MGRRLVLEGRRTTGIEHSGHDVPKPQPPTWHDVDEEEPRSRRGMERVARWPRRQPRQVRQRARTLRAVGWFSTGRSARGPSATELGSIRYSILKPQPPTWRGIGAEEPWHMAWGGACPALTATTTTTSPLARACSVSGRLILPWVKRAGAATHSIQKLWLRPFEATAADLARCR